MTTLRVILAAFMMAGMSACGQTGALYLPDRVPPKINHHQTQAILTPRLHPLAAIMSHFTYVNGKLHAEQTALERIAAEFGTPTYVYSRASLTENFLSYASACQMHGRGQKGALVCYSVKSNSNLAVLNLLSKLGSGFDIVSGGELERVIAAGGDAKKLFFQVWENPAMKCAWH